MIEFKCNHFDCIDITYTVKDEGDIHSITQDFKNFLLAVGYQPKTVDLIRTDGE